MVIILIYEMIQQLVIKYADLVPEMGRVYSGQGESYCLNKGLLRALRSKNGRG